MSTRLFEQAENNNPALTKKIAFGGSATITENITFTNFLTWLYGKLGFLKVTENLNDLNSKPTARTNLGVYSSGETDDLLDLKAPLYPEVGGALGSNNTVTFTPTGSYNPATKLYVDDGGVSSGWLDGTRNVTFVEPTNFSCKVARVGGFVTITGRLEVKAGSGADSGDLLVTLPVSIPLCTIDIYFIAADHNNDEVLEVMIPAGTQTIVISGAGPSTGTLMNYHVTYPHI